MTVTMYGIRNCDTIKKARAWLDARGIGYAFHDYKNAGVERDRLAAWCAELGWETLLNRAGTTFRKLAPAEQQDLDAEKAIALMMAHPSMIKRPILDLGDRRLAGFRTDRYEAAFPVA